MYTCFKAFFGLCQASRAWNAKLDKCLKEFGFVKCPCEHVFYAKQNEGNVMMVRMCVDDIMVLEQVSWKLLLSSHK